MSYLSGNTFPSLLWPLYVDFGSFYTPLKSSKHDFCLDIYIIAKSLLITKTFQIPGRGNHVQVRQSKKHARPMFAKSLESCHLKRTARAKGEFAGGTIVDGLLAPALKLSVPG
jgi:hypothetical protein